jgi:S-adenosylmethionine-diacylglycerol 3-amino-3-carboxypropyl transferase
MAKAKDIKYANCWEDADVLLKSSGIKEGGVFLSIASGGDNTIALLTRNPSRIIAIDMNLAQLFLCELKIEAFRQLDYAQLLGFLGIYNQSDRLNLYSLLSSGLSEECKNYWSQNLLAIEEGIIHCGKFENYFSLFRKRVMPFIHSRSKINALMQEKTPQEQEVFFNKKWNSWRWKVFTKLFFSRFVMGNLGRTSSYLNQVEIPVSDYIQQKSKVHLRSDLCQNNYFLHFIFKGDFGKNLPFYLREENFGNIKKNLGAIELKLGKVEDCLDNKTTFDFCNFSNIFEYMTKEDFRSFNEMMYTQLAEEASISYWNLMVDRVFAEDFPNHYIPNKNVANVADMGFFYKRFMNDIKQ